MDQIPDCPICKTRTLPLYRDLEDGLYGVPGRYHFSRCPSCGLIRLDNRPDREKLFSLYENYYTRTAAAETPGDTPQRRFVRFRDGLRTAILCGRFGYRDGHRRHGLCRLGPLMSMVPGLRNRAVYDGLRESFPAFPNRTDNLLIDVGCGRGDFLALMKPLGWNVLGIEPDPVASELARARGVDVFGGCLEEAGLAGGIADQVSLNHVLEHVHDPAGLLKECRRVLRPGGSLVIYTPNAESLGHRWFGKDWRGLEPPRHLFVFSPQALRRMLEETPFRSFRMKTPTTLAGGIYDDSVRIRREGSTPLYGGKPENGRGLFRGMERLLCLSGQYRGEEIEVVARREAGRGHRYRSGSSARSAAADPSALSESGVTPLFPDAQRLASRCAARPL